MQAAVTAELGQQLPQKSGLFMVVIAMVRRPGWSRSSGTSASQTASTPTGSSPATTSYQYQPPSMNGLSERSKVNSPLASAPVPAESTRCERPFAIER